MRIVVCMGDKRFVAQSVIGRGTRVYRTNFGSHTLSSLSDSHRGSIRLDSVERTAQCVCEFLKHIAPAAVSGL